MKARIPYLVSALALAAACGGCAASRGRTPVSSTATTSAAVAAKEAGHATASVAVAVRAEEDDAEDDPRGVVVVGGDVIAQCPDVRAVHVKADDTMAWLHLLKSVAHCMNDGELRTRHLVLRGPTRPQVIVKYILSRVGVTEDRVDLTTVTGEPTCADDCDASEMRVEIGIAGADSAVSQTL